MPRNYYAILGVTTNASLDEIKAAFRRRALELHPDRTGQASGPFIEAQEAYAVLSDPNRRRQYDQRTSIGVRRRPWGPSPEPFAPPSPETELLGAVWPVSELHEFDFDAAMADYHPSFDELFDRLWSNFEPLARPKGERLESLTLEVVLRAHEARRGGRVRVGVPARATCPTCGGHGAVGPYECWQCEGRGALTTEYPLDIEYSPGVPDGTVVRLPLERFGIENFYLTVLFRVRDGGD